MENLIQVACDGRQRFRRAPRLLRSLSDFGDLPTSERIARPIVSFSLATFVMVAALLVVAASAEIARAQIGPAEAIRRQQAAEAAADAERAEYSAAKRQASIMKRQRNTSLKQWEKMVVPLNSQDLAQWTKTKNSRGTFWKYEIKRNKGTIAVAYFSPQIGYVVNDKFQKNGLGWLTLDEAIQKHFNKDEVWGLPDIPGWSKSHLLTSDEQIADMKRKALEKAKPKAVDKIADKVADRIVDQLGPKIGEDIGKDLGINMAAGKKDGKAANNGSVRQVAHN